MVSGSKQKTQKREPLNPISEPLNPTNSVDPERLWEDVFPQSEGHPHASMAEEGEDEEVLGESCALSLEEVIRRRSNRAKRLSRVYRKQYWALMEEVRFRYREYYWKFGKSGCKEREEWENEGGGSGSFPGRENGDHGFPMGGFPAAMEEDERRFFGSAGNGGGLAYVDRLGQDGGGFQDRSGENGFGFAGRGFPAGVESGFLGESGDNGFGFPDGGFRAKDGRGFVVKSEENQFGYPESGFPAGLGQDGGRFLGANGENQFGFPDSGFPVKGSQDGGPGLEVKAEENEFGFAEGGFPLKTRMEGCGYGGKSSENGYAFAGSAFPGKVGHDACGISAKSGENCFPVKTCQEESLVPGRTGENCVAYQEKAGERTVDSRCGFAGCKMKPMDLSCFCHSHILSDSKQQLYKPCTYVIKSGQTGPITCGKPVLRAVVPSLCSVHFQKAQKHLARSLKKAGHNTSFSNMPAPKSHVIVAEYVRCIQAKRKDSDTGSKLRNKEIPIKVDLPVKMFNAVKDEVME